MVNRQPVTCTNVTKQHSHIRLRNNDANPVSSSMLRADPRGPLSAAQWPGYRDLVWRGWHIFADLVLTPVLGAVKSLWNVTKYLLFYKNNFPWYLSTKDFLSSRFYWTFMRINGMWNSNTAKCPQDELRLGHRDFSGYIPSFRLWDGDVMHRLCE